MPSSQKQSTIHFVVGPTASGKTKHAVELAQEFNGELINADSRQIYKYLDIGTNKEPVTALDGEFRLLSSTDVRIHLISLLEPDQCFSVYEFQQLAANAIQDIVKRGKTPIVVGGTGLWVDSLLHPERYQFTQQADGALREELNALDTAALQSELNKLAPAMFSRLNPSDASNPRRLIRAIESVRRAVPNPNEHVILSSLKETSELAWYKQALHNTLQPQVHYLQLEMSDLTERINARVLQMWEAGLVQETKDVLAMGFPATSTALQGIGYREVLRYISGELDEKSTIQLIQLAHRQYAKRQITWFKKHL